MIDANEHTHWVEPFASPDVPLTTSHQDDVDETSRKRSVVAIGASFAVGLVLDLLFRHANLGVNLSIAMTTLGAGSAIALGPRRPTRVTVLALIALVMSATAFSLRASAWSGFWSFATSAWLVAILPVVASERTLFGEVETLPLRFLMRILFVVDGMIDSFQTVRSATSSPGLKRWRGVLVGLLLGAPLTAVFGLLLSEDPGFSRVVHGITSRVNEAFEITITAAVLGVFVMLGTATHSAAARSRVKEQLSLDELSPYRTTPVKEGTLRAPEGTLSTVAWGTVLAMVASMFLLFFVANARTLFAGHAAVRSTASTTYSSYLHAGFNQLVVATFLSVITVVMGHALVGRDELERVRGGRVLKAIELALIGLTGVTVVSCWQRLSIYENAYGATFLRVFVAAILVGALALLGLAAVKSLRRHWKGFASALIALVTTFGVGCSLFDADGYIVSTNLERVSTSAAALDVDYLRGMSSDACSATSSPAFMALSEDVQRDLKLGWARNDAKTDWRSFRGARRCR
jgi:hypothetical protein